MTAFQGRNVRASKLTVRDVQEIRRFYGQGTVSQGQLARDYKVSIVTIGRIVRGEVWQSVPVLDHLMSEGEIKESALRMLALQRELEEGKGMGKLAMVAAELGRGDAMLEELQERPMIRSPLDE